MEETQKLRWWVRLELQLPEVERVSLHVRAGASAPSDERSWDIGYIYIHIQIYRLI